MCALPNASLNWCANHLVPSLCLAAFARWSWSPESQYLRSVSYPGVCLTAPNGTNGTVTVSLCPATIVAAANATAANATAANATAAMANATAANSTLTWLVANATRL
jgi:hypothetical protein